MLNLSRRHSPRGCGHVLIKISGEERNAFSVRVLGGDSDTGFEPQLSQAPCVCEGRVVTTLYLRFLRALVKGLYSLHIQRINYPACAPF